MYLVYLICRTFIFLFFKFWSFLEFFIDIFDFHTPGCRCNWPSSMKFIVYLVLLICKAQFLHLYLFPSFEVFKFFLFFYQHLIPSYSWGSLWYFFYIILYWLFKSFFNSFNHWLIAMNFCVHEFHLIPCVLKKYFNSEGWPSLTPPPSKVSYFS